MDTQAFLFPQTVNANESTYGEVCCTSQVTFPNFSSTFDTKVLSVSHAEI